MKFECNTKPLADALELGVINSNVSNFHKKSTVAQVSIQNNILRINLEASYVKTEIVLKGHADSSESASIFVGSLLLKQLVNSLESNTVSLEFTEGGLVIHSGKSKFTLPKLVDDSELELDAPESIAHLGESSIIDKSEWKFIKDKQMYAIAMSFIHPVYTRVWVGSTGDVLVGDFDNSLFTHSVKSHFGDTCLLSDTIINLFNAIPEGSRLYKASTGYIINYSCDAFTYVAQFEPQYESDDNIGSYNSDIFLDMMDHPDSGVIRVAGTQIAKFLSQASLFASGSEDTIEFSVSPGVVEIKDKNVDCKIDITDSVPDPYSIVFKSESLRKVVTNYGEEDLHISPLKQEDAVVGILVWDDDLTTVIAGVE